MSEEKPTHDIPETEDPLDPGDRRKFTILIALGSIVILLVGILSFRFSLRETNGSGFQTFRSLGSYFSSETRDGLDRIQEERESTTNQ